MAQTIQDMSVVELEALAYDTLAQIQNLQGQLQTVNQMIGEKAKNESKYYYEN